MGQMGFFDLGNRYTGLDAKNEPLLKIDGVVPWEDLRARLEAVWRRADKVRKSRAGRKPWDAIVMFKTIILCALYNLSDDQVEHQIRDRLSFMRFLGLGLRVPDAKTVWLYREQLTQAGVIEALFETFDGYLKDQGYLAMGGQIIDASIVAVPKQRNSREENARIKAGETPAGWEDKPAKRRQKDVEARWTKKHGKSHYGYKNHVNVDRRHKLVRRYHVSDAAEHDRLVSNHVISLWTGALLAITLVRTSDCCLRRTFRREYLKLVTVIQVDANIPGTARTANAIGAYRKRAAVGQWDCHRLVRPRFDDRLPHSRSS